MFHATRDDTEFSLVQHDTSVPEFDGHLSAPNQEHFILQLVMMPGEDTAQLDELDFLAIQGRDHLRAPMLMDQCKLFVQ